MTWKPIVAGVDATPEGIRAAVTAARLAETAHTKCVLVHAVRDPWTASPIADLGFSVPMNLPEQNRMVIDSARTLLAHYLTGHVSASVLDRLDIRLGPASVVIEEAAEEHDAELVVLGGKHHTGLGRWLAGSTVHHMVRRMDRPILVVAGSPGTSATPFHRVLAAVDLSQASMPTLDAAERFARLSGASMRLLHVVEPVPVFPEPPFILEADLFDRAEEEMARNIRPRVTLPGTEHFVRRGPAVSTLAAAVTEWNADLLVVGTHGRGWVDRILIGSVTERLLNALPTSMLVIPVSAPAPRLVAGAAPATASRSVKRALSPKARR